MAAPNILQKFFQSFGGLNLRVSDLSRPGTDATEIKNMSMRKTGAMSKRKGFQILAESTGGYGTTTFPNIDVDTGVTSEELITLDDNLYKQVDDSFTITYAGVLSAYYDMYVDTDNRFKFDIYDNGVQLLNADLGTGKETSFVTLSDLLILINALTDFSATAAGITTEAAAFIPTASGIAISTAGTVLGFSTLVQIDTPDSITDPFSTYYAARNQDDFENATFATVNNVLYIATGYDALHKYDSLRTYKAGLPSPSDAPSLNLVAGALTGAYKYKYFYRYIDAKDNFVESNASPIIESSPSSENVEVTVDNIQSSSGFNTDQAIVNGNQSGVNIITVTTGHSIKVGDDVYFLDGITSEFVTRAVTAVAATTITIDGSTVDVNTAEIINPQLSVVVLRTVDTGTLFFEVVSLVNDSANATQVYTDSTIDVGLIIEYLEPFKTRDLPPDCKYLDVWRNILIMTGSITNPNTVYYSDLDSPEYFPGFDNNFVIETNDGSKNSGVRSLDNLLYVFKKNSIAGVTGDLGLDQFQVDIISKQGVGCSAHATLSEVNNRVWFLSQYGIYSIGSGGLQKESENIDPKFNSPNSFNFNRATAFYWTDADQYIIQLPITATSSGNYYYDSSTEVYVYDVFRQAWLQWDNFDIGGGMTEFKGDIYFQSKEINASSVQQHFIKRVHSSGQTQDYCDHEAAIPFVYKTHWETMGEPSLFKKFLRIKVHSLDASLGNFESEGFNLDIKTEHNYINSTVSSLTMDFTGGALGWGLSAWNGFPWGEKRLSGIKSKLNNGKTKSLRVIFENEGLAENVLISGYTMDIVAPYQLALKE